MDAPTHLRTTRVRLGLTQAQLAEAAGCTQSDISKYESGTRPNRLDVITKLAAALGITREEVIFGPSPKEGNRDAA